MTDEETVLLMPYLIHLGGISVVLYSWILRAIRRRKFPDGNIPFTHSWQFQDDGLNFLAFTVLAISAAMRGSRLWFAVSSCFCLLQAGVYMYRRSEQQKGH